MVCRCHGIADGNGKICSWSTAWATWICPDLTSSFNMHGDSIKRSSDSLFSCTTQTPRYRISRKKKSPHRFKNHNMVVTWKVWRKSFFFIMIPAATWDLLSLVCCALNKPGRSWGISKSALLWLWPLIKCSFFFSIHKLFWIGELQLLWRAECILFHFPRKILADSHIDIH